MTNKVMILCLGIMIGGVVVGLALVWLDERNDRIHKDLGGRVPKVPKPPKGAGLTKS